MARLIAAVLYLAATVVALGAMKIREDHMIRGTFAWWLLAAWNASGLFLAVTAL